VTVSEPTHATGDVARPRRARQTVFDMARSLGLMAVVVGATLLFVPSLLHPSKADRFPAFDYSDVLDGFHQVTGVTALAPTGLPSSWRATSGTLTGPTRTEHLLVGFAAPGSTYAGLEESVGPSAALVGTALGPSGARAHGTVPVGGVLWQRRTSSKGETALLHRSGRVTVIVTGSASLRSLVSLAASLHPTAG
jgi:hypothetical protein